MARKQATLVATVLLVSLILSLGVERTESYECKFMGSCRTDGDCQKVCSAGGFDRVAVKCVPYPESQLTCCCIIEDPKGH